MKEGDMEKTHIVYQKRLDEGKKDK